MILNNIDVVPINRSVRLNKQVDGNIQCQSLAKGGNVGVFFHAKLNFDEEYVFHASGYSKEHAKALLWVGIPHPEGSCMGGLGYKLSSSNCFSTDEEDDSDLRFVLSFPTFHRPSNKTIVRLAILFDNAKPLDTFVLSDIAVCEANKFDIALLKKQVGLLKAQNEALQKEVKVLSDSVASLSSQAEQVDDDLEENRERQNQVIAETEGRLRQMVTQDQLRREMVSQDALREILHRFTDTLNASIIRYVSDYFSLDHLVFLH